MTTDESRHLSWERFEQLIHAGPPAVEVVRGEPRVEIFTDAGGARIGVRTPTPGTDFPPSPLVEIDVRQRRLGDTDVVEISTTNDALYRDFYAFACAVADRLQIDGMPAGAAVDSALEAWAALLQRLALLSDERQVGLLGELWLLRRLAATLGWTTALDAWKGSDAEEHDFSWVAADVEVKTTTSERRVHMIGSLTQLAPTGSRPLFVLSLQLTRAGAGPGESLADAVRVVADSVITEPAARRRLDEQLQRAGWRPEHAVYYRRRYVLRAPPSLVPVDDACPAITPSTLRELGPDKLARLGQVAYRVDLTDLGHQDGTPEFQTVIPEESAS
jgi:hypothetical protein